MREDRIDLKKIKLNLVSIGAAESVKDLQKEFEGLISDLKEKYRSIFDIVYEFKIEPAVKLDEEQRLIITDKRQEK